MYMIYLSLLIALSTGVGAFTHYDATMKQRDAAETTRMEVAEQQQEVVARALRREYQIDPSAFPTAAPGTLTKLNDSLLDAVNATGMTITGQSNYYINSAGEIVAVIKSGPSAPVSKNGDQELGISARPQFLREILEFLFGRNFERGPTLTYLEERGGGTSAIAMADTITTQDLEALGDAAYATIAQLGTATAEGTDKIEETVAGLAGSVAATLGADDDYAAIAARIGLEK